MSAPIEAGACYRDPKDGEIVRALRPSPHYQHGWLCQPLSGVYRGQAEVYRALLNWQRVPDPTPAVIDDEPVHDEAARQERVDATAQRLWVMPEYDSRNVDQVYRDADMLEAARERYIAGRKGAVKP